jgi:DNA-binding GntR family transcriptional regulator
MWRRLQAARESVEAERREHGRPPAFGHERGERRPRSWWCTTSGRCPQAIIDGDGEAAERAAAQHVLRFKDEIRQVI